MNSTSNQLSPLKRALLALDEMQAKLEAAERMRHEPIAVIGMSCRFPGGATDPHAFWNVLATGIEAVGDIPSDRWDVDAFYDPDPETPGKMYTKRGGFLTEVDTFDPQFFGISPREAMGMDPQQRLLLEVSWEALENAGQICDRLAGRQTGVFIGITSHDYEQIHLQSGDLSGMDTYHITGNSLNSAAGRLSYILGFHGPCMAVDTACSSSLVALHLACRSLLNRECDSALTGGVNLILSPVVNIGLCKTRVLSFEGKCQAYDAAADGMVRGEGCGVLVLKRLTDAQRDGDPLFALIRGSAVNQDGPSSGLTVPNGPAQEMLIRRALASAKIAPSDVDYIEAHGTGTSLGDPIELRALHAVYGRERDPSHPLKIGSVKTNIGHLEAGSGIAGLIKLILALNHEEIPPHLNFKQPTPHFNWNDSPLAVVTQRTPWPRGERKRLAGVSSFGFSGVNAHVIVEEAPRHTTVENQIDRPLHILTLSAYNDAALHQLAGKYEEHLTVFPDLSPGDLAFSANVGRGVFNQRLALVFNSIEEARAKLSDFRKGRSHSEIRAGHCKDRPQPAFLFTGQGSQYVGMGRTLFATCPTFRRTLERCQEVLRQYLEKPLLQVLFEPSPEKEWLNETAYTQPALFALEYALSVVWESWGITPRFVMGHSVGEYAAACVADVFSLEDGLKLIAERARLMQALPDGGGMLAVAVSEQRALQLIESERDRITLAVINAPASVVLSGDLPTLQKMAPLLSDKGIAVKFLPVSHAFHSPLMEPMLAAFERVARSVEFHPPRYGLISNLDGKLVSREIASPDYWIRHVRQPVRFFEGMKTLQEQGVGAFFEIGPNPVLLGMGRQCIEDRGEAWLPSLRAGQDDWRMMLESLAELYVRGAQFDGIGFERDYHRQRVLLPNYPFQRERYWVEKDSPFTRPALRTVACSTSKPAHPLLGQRILLAGTHEIRYEAALRSNAPGFLEHHKIGETVVLPATAYFEMILAAGADIFSNEAVSVTDVVMQQALMLPEHQDVLVQTVLVPEKDDEWTFRIFSGGNPDTPEPSDWTLHVIGKLKAEHTPSDREPRVISPPLKPDVELSVEKFYQQCRARGINFGPMFQALESLHRDELTSFGWIRLPESLASTLKEYSFHPVLMDAGLQVLAAHAADTDPQSVYLPIGLERLCVFRQPENRLWSRAVLRPVDDENPNVVVFDITLGMEDGSLVAKLDGLQLAKTSLASLVPKPAPFFADWLVEVQWETQPLNETISAPAHESFYKGRWLICSDGSKLGHRLGMAIESKGGDVFYLHAGSAYNRHSERRITLTGTDPQSYTRALADLGGKPFDGILFLCECQPNSDLPINSSLGSHTSNASCRNLLYLLQAIAKQRTETSPRLWLFTRNAQAVLTGDTLAGLPHAPLWGMGRSLMQERPEWRFTLVDLEPDTSDDDIAGILSELVADSPENQIAFRNHSRYVARLKPRTVSSEWEQDDAFAIRDDGAYVIVGGCGGLGLQVARWLVACGARSLLLIGRSGVKDQSIRTALERLESDGARVMVAKADVANEEQLTWALAEVRKTLAPIRGVIHTAAVLDDALLENLDWACFQRVLAAKVEGAWLLHQLTLHDSLDFFVCFSSAASLWGAPGQSNYAAANAFLDALVHYRRTLNHPALAVNWAAWSEVGVAARHLLDRQIAQKGIDPLAPDQGIQILQYLIRQNAPQVGVLPIRWEVFAQQWESGKHPPFLEGLLQRYRRSQTSSPVVESLSGLGRELRALALPDRIQQLTGVLRDLIAVVLRIPLDKLPVDRPLNTVGVDSLMAVELRNRVRIQLEVDVPIVKFLAGLDVAGVAEDIARCMDTISREPSADRTPGSTSPVSGDRPSVNNLKKTDELELLDRLDQLSDEEIDALLQSELNHPNLPT